MRKAYLFHRWLFVEVRKVDAIVRLLHIISSLLLNDSCHMLTMSRYLYCFPLTCFLIYSIFFSDIERSKWNVLNTYKYNIDSENRYKILGKYHPSRWLHSELLSNCCFVRKDAAAEWSLAMDRCFFSKGWLWNFIGVLELWRCENVKTEFVVLKIKGVMHTYDINFNQIPWNNPKSIGKTSRIPNRKYLESWNLTPNIYPLWISGSQD